MKKTDKMEFFIYFLVLKEAVTSGPRREGGNGMDTEFMNRALRRRGFRPRRSLGQNFLFDSSLLARIVQASQTGPGDAVLEIGAGPGTLTLALSRCAARVTAVEVDQSLAGVLVEAVGDAPNVVLVFEDIMKTDLGEIHRTHLGGGPFRVVANLPYYITTPILMRLLESGLPIVSITVMVQKEVALRVCARPGGKDYGVLSVMAQLYAQPVLIETVPASAFVPSPRVDSALLHMPVREALPVDIPSPEAFHSMVQAAFSQRRKQIVNSLSSGLALPRELTGKLLESAGIRPEDRAETLDLNAFAALTRAYERIGS